MYGQDNTEERGNRITFYVFNSTGDRRVGSYFHDPIQAGNGSTLWEAPTASTHIYRDGRDGALRDSDRYSGTISPEHGTIERHRFASDEIFGVFVKGAVGEVRIWRRALTAEVGADLHAAGKVPQQGLVAELLYNVVTAGPSNPKHGAIFGATCSGGPWRHPRRC